MKKCPNCAEENLDNASFCYHCGYDLRAWSVPPTDPTQQPTSGSANDIDRTQPLHRKPAPQQPTYSPPPAAPGSYQTQPYPPPASQGTYSYPPQQPYQQQPYQQSQPYPPTDPYPPQYVPPPPAYPAYPPTSGQGVLQKGRSNRFWLALVIGLGSLLLCVCVMAVYTLTSATGNGVAQLGSQMSTQAAGVLAPPATGVSPTEIGQMDTPTPWPTFTAQPTQPSAPTENPAQPAPTQAPFTDKLLTPECSNALDRLGQASNQVTSQPLKLLDETWRNAFNQSLADMKANCGSLDTASPLPGEVTTVHRDLAQASGEYDQASQLWNDGIAKRDPGKLLQAAQHLQQATKYLNQAISGLKQIVQ